MLARPEHRPGAALGRSDERVGNAAPVKIATEIDDQQTIVATIAEEAQKERLGAEDRAVERARPLRREHAVLASQAQEVAVEGDGLGMMIELRPIELAGLKGLKRFRLAGRAASRPK